MYDNKAHNTTIYNICYNTQHHQRNINPNQYNRAPAPNPKKPKKN